jgi:RNA polymerase sigma factor (sigma-70 family)
LAAPGPSEKEEATTRPGSVIDAESRRALRRFILAELQNAQDADDLAQDTCLRYLSSRQDVRKPLSLLFKIAENLIHEYRYRKRREQQFAEQAEQEAWHEAEARGADPGEELATAELLNRVLLQVPEAYRKVLILHKRDRMTAKQIGEKLGLSERTVEHYVARALTYARNALWK